jgi:hypothetical protein
LAVTQENLSGKPFSWIREIEYVGMTNSKGGLKGRLKQFDNTICGNTGHGGAQRFRHNYPDKNDIKRSLYPILYVSVAPYKCNVTSNKPEDLLVMGDVAKAEFECWARYSGDFNQLPKYNDKKNSPKLPKDANSKEDK